MIVNPEVKAYSGMLLTGLPRNRVFIMNVSLCRSDYDVQPLAIYWYDIINEIGDLLTSRT